MLALVLVTTAARAETIRADVASHQQDRVTCSIAAALKFGVPANIMLAVAEMEGGRPGQRVRNHNGSFDVGPMQFNTRYLQHLERRYGITAADVAAADCYPYELAAWRLRKHLELDAGDVWTKIANYHSRNHVNNGKYRRRLIVKAGAWARWLAPRFATHEISRAIFQRARRQRAVNAPARYSAQAEDRDDNEHSDLEGLLKQLDDGESDRETRRIETQSTAAAHAGPLIASVRLPRHPGYKLTDATRAWGTSRTIDSITAAFNELVTSDPTAPPVEVHDLSLRFGGRLRGHKSHQSGHDVDITYYQRICHPRCIGRHVLPAELDARREWSLLRYWLERGQAEFIFIDYSLQRPLYDAAKTSGATERQLVDWFQYPRGASVRTGIIRHVPNHANHVHVRFRCAAEAPSCTPTSSTRGLDPVSREEAEEALIDLMGE
jgi:murein endopeptidase